MNKYRIEHHAILYALLVKNILKYTNNDTLVQEMTYQYGYQRGRRMRQYALEKELPINLSTFFLVGEWRAEDDEPNQSFLENRQTDTYSHVQQCAWHEAWKKNDLLSYGKYYCASIDCGIHDGFGGDYQLDIPSVLTDGKDECIFHWHTTNQTNNAEKENIKPFSFHCKDLMQCASTFLKNHCPNEFESILNQTKQDFTKLYPMNHKEIFEVNNA